MRAWLALLFLSLIVACAPAKPAPVAAPAPALERIVVGTSGRYPPLSEWLPGAPPDGFALALLRGFEEDTRRQASIVRFDWPDLARDLAAKKFDVAFDGITVRPERSIAGIYTVPIARGGAILLVKRASWSNDLAALDRADRTIGVNYGGHLEKVTREKFRAARIRAIEGNALRDLLRLSEVDAVMTNTFEAPHLQERVPDLVAVGPLTRDTTALWVRADREDLATALDDWLVDAEAAGKLSALRVRWFGASTPATAHPLGALFAATSERLALMPFVAAAKARANLPIDDPAQEERVLASAKEEVAKAAKALGRPAPPPDAVEAFFRAQFDAAKEVQRARTTTAQYSLDQLRGAIGRITRRMARLFARLEVEDEAAALKEAHEHLDGSGLSPETIARLATVHARRATVRAP